MGGQAPFMLGQTPQEAQRAAKYRFILKGADGKEALGLRTGAQAQTLLSLPLPKNPICSTTSCCGLNCSPRFLCGSPKPSVTVVGGGPVRGELG